MKSAVDGEGRSSVRNFKQKGATHEGMGDDGGVPWCLHLEVVEANSLWAEYWCTIPAPRAPRPASRALLQPGGTETVRADVLSRMTDRSRRACRAPACPSAV